MAGTPVCPNGHGGTGPDDAFCAACGAALVPQPAPGPLGLTWQQSFLAMAGALVLLGGAVTSSFAFRDEPAGGGVARASDEQARTQPAPATAESATATGASPQQSPSPTTPSQVPTVAAPPGQPSVAAAAAAPATARPPTASQPSPPAPNEPSTATKPPPTATIVPPTATKPPPTNTPVPTAPPNIRVYGTMTLGGSPCGGCEAAFLGPKQITFVAAPNGSYDTRALGFALPPGTYTVYYTCQGKLVSTGQTLVLQGPDVRLDIKIGFCG